MVDAKELRSGARSLIAALTPHPHRGDLIAAGALPLTLGVLLVNVRLDAQWGTGVMLVLTALTCALVLGMGVLAPLEGERPRPYQQVLLLSGLTLGFVVLLRLAQVLGADAPLVAAGSRMWIFGIVALAAVALLRLRRAAICALIAALAGVVTVLAFVSWAFAPDGPTTARWVLLALALGLVLLALSQRDAQRRESVYMVDAAGLAILALGLTFVGALIGALTLVGIPSGGPGGGWKLLLLAAGFGLVAYAAVDREPGPAYVGAANLLLALGLIGLPGVEGASLWFWPLMLLLAGGAMVAAGLRPRRPLPPEPPGPTAPAEPLPGPGAPGGLWSSARPGEEP
ncbi:MAG: hypothetical protein WBC33_07250 [Conexibacter sp.]